MKESNREALNLLETLLEEEEGEVCGFRVKVDEGERYWYLTKREPQDTIAGRWPVTKKEIAPGWWKWTY